MDDDKDANKSEISLVFEIALKRNMPVSFEVRAQQRSRGFPTSPLLIILNKQTSKHS